MRIRLLMLIGVIGVIGSATAAPTARAAEASGDAQQSAAPGIQGASVSASQKAPEVTVLGRRFKLEPRVQSYVYGIAALQNNEGVARWNSPVCPLVTGLLREQGEFILERLSEVARAAGIPLGDEHCAPNLFIVVTGQPQQLLEDLDTRKHFAAFGDATPLAVQVLIDTPRPVRVWYNITRGAMGMHPSPGLPPDVEIRGAGGSMGLPLLTVADGNNGSHLLNAVAYSFTSVLVIADQAQLRGLSVRQFADYVAMVGLAEIKPTPHWSATRSILGLFGGDPAAAPAAMGEWDRLFLKYLYATNGALKAQRAQIGWNIVRELIH